jgi:hypothetical protein
MLHKLMKQSENGDSSQGLLPDLVLNLSSLLIFTAAFFGRRKDKHFPDTKTIYILSCRLTYSIITNFRFLINND